MTEHRLVFRTPEGRVSIGTPVEKEKSPAESTDGWLGRIAAKSEALGYTKIGRCVAADLPPGRANRGAWRVEAGTGKVVVDLAAAQKLKLAQVRAIWRYNIRKLKEGLEWAQASGDTAAQGLVQQDIARMGRIATDAPAELQRMLDAGDEAAIGAFEPEWPRLEGPLF